MLMLSENSDTGRINISYTETVYQKEALICANITEVDI